MTNENDDTDEARLAAAGRERLAAARAVSQTEVQLRTAGENHRRAMDRYKKAVDNYDSIESDIARGVTRRSATPENKT